MPSKAQTSPPPLAPNQLYQNAWMQVFFNSSDSDWLDNLLHGGADELDVIEDFTYIGETRSWEECGEAESIAPLCWRMDQNPLLQDKDSGITNNAWWSLWTADRPRLQAAYAVRDYALAASLGIIPHEQNAYFAPAGAP